jgi:3-oxoadipate enol-lactonase
MKTQINGVNLGYEMIGEGKLPVVLIHGFGLNRSIWLDMVRDDLQDYKVILPDVRGHGESDASEGAYPMSLLADDLVGLLDHLRIEKAVVCGHSMGGYIALAFADRYPDRLAGLGLITSRSGADSEEKRQGRFQLVEEVRARGSVVLAESLAFKITRDPVLQQFIYDLILTTNPLGIIGAALGMAERPDRADMLRHLDRPVLITAGVEDQIVPLEEAGKIADLLVRGTFTEIPCAGHLPMMETPVILSEVVKGWLFMR